jgi:AcrR family transcriptional regulator
MSKNEWSQFQVYILQLEREGLVTRTFRRLDPERQQAVLDAILDEASERGPINLNIKQVAERANVSVGSLYQYFTDRDRMLSFAIELSRRYIQDTFRQYQEYLASLPLREALYWYILGGIEWGQTENRFVKFSARAAYQGDPELVDSVVLPIANIMRDMVEEILMQALNRGELRSNIDLEEIIPIIHTLSIAIGDSFLIPNLNNYYLLDKNGKTAEETVKAFIDVILNGISKETD